MPRPSPPITGGTYTLQTPYAIHPLDAVASVHMDPHLNVTSLNLRPGREVHAFPDGTAQIVEAGTKGQTVLANKPRPVQPPTPGVMVRKKHQALTEELQRAHEDESVAIQATNFILA